MLGKTSRADGDASIGKSLSQQNNSEHRDNPLHGKFSRSRSVAQTPSTSTPEWEEQKGLSLAAGFGKGSAIDARTKFKNVIEKVMFLTPNTRKGEVGLIEHTRLEALDIGKHRIYSMLNVVHVDWRKTGQQHAGFFEWLDMNPDHQFPVFDPKKVVEEWKKIDSPGTADAHVWARENLHQSAAAVVGYRSVKDIEQTRFLSEHEIGQYRATIKDGIWHRMDEQATLVDTMASPGKINHAENFPQHGVFILHRNGDIYIHDYERNKVHHPMTTGGAPVLASAIIKIENGVATSFALISGHYRCGPEELERVLIIMKEGKVDLRKMHIEAPSIDKGALQQLLKKYQ